MTFVDELKISDAKRTVWIFGAGASVPYKVPAQAQVLARFAKAPRPGPAAAKVSLDNLRKRVQTHCNRVLPGLPMDDPAVTLEEIFSAYELALADPRSTRDEVTNAQKALDDLLQALRIATQVFGRGDANKYKPHARSGTKSPYAELIEKLFPAGATGNVAHTFVTFNYDVILDRCLINLKGSSADFDVDYGLAMANARCAKAPGFDAPRADRSILLLRTHGGLNWIRCRACRSIFTTVSQHKDIPEDLSCYACGKARMDYILVHPSYLRSYDDPALQFVWGRTYEELRKAERWVLVGYSLPPADVHFRELLRDSLRDRNKKSTEVVLVTRGPSTEQSFQNAVSTYKHIFESKLRVWNATTNGFSDFVKALKP